MKKILFFIVLSCLTLAGFSQDDYKTVDRPNITADKVNLDSTDYDTFTGSLRFENGEFWGYDGNVWLQFGSSGLTFSGDTVFISYHAMFDSTARFYSSVIFEDSIRQEGLSLFKDNVTIDASRLIFANTGNSVFIGEDAGLVDDLTNNHNVFIGYKTGEATTSGYGNIALGYYAFNTNTGGDFNIAIGDYVLENNGGSGNIGIGQAALNLNTGGEQNISIGVSSSSKLTGSFNFAGGYQSLKETTTGQYNVALGWRSLDANIEGEGDVAIGSDAGNNKTTGDNNVFVGLNSGATIGSGASLLTSNGSVFVGKSTRASIDGSTNEAVIGANAIGNGDNTFTAGDDNVTDAWMNEDGTAIVHLGSILFPNGATINNTDADTLEFVEANIMATGNLITNSIIGIGTNTDIVITPNGNGAVVLANQSTEAGWDIINQMEFANVMAPRSYWFDGDDDNIALADRLWDGHTGSTISVSGWAYANDYTGNNTLVQFGGSGTDAGIWFYSVGIAWALDINNGTSTNNTDFSNYTTMLENQWFHWAVTADLNGYKKLYINGVAVDSIDISALSGTFDDNTGSFKIGRGVNSWSGQQSDVKAWTKLLTADEINALAKGGEVPYIYQKADVNVQTAGILVVGREYIITLFVGGDDFTNVGGTNVTGNVFIATGVTPATWTNSSQVDNPGCVLNLDKNGISDLSWLDQSGNNYHGLVSGATVSNGIVFAVFDMTLSYQIQVGSDVRDINGVIYYESEDSDQGNTTIDNTDEWSVNDFTTIALNAPTTATGAFEATSTVLFSGGAVTLDNGAILNNTTHADTLALIETNTKIDGTLIVNTVKGIGTNIDIGFLPIGTGVLNVNGTTNYETNVTADDDIPNKKYVDDALPASLWTDDGTRTYLTVSAEPAEFRKSGLAHGMTGLADTDAYGNFNIVDGSDGGLRIIGLSTTADVEGIRISAAMVNATPTDYPMKFTVAKKASTTWSPLGGTKLAFSWWDDTQLRMTLNTNADITISDDSDLAAKNYHQFSIYHSDPAILLTDRDINLKITSAVEAADTNAIWLIADNTTPEIGMSNATGDDWQMTMHATDDTAIFENAEAYSFDNVILGTSATFTGLLNQSVAAGLTAVNPGVQGDGALTANVNEVSTVGADNDARTLPAAPSTGSLTVTIINNGANILEIWPASGDDLGAGVDTATQLAAGAKVIFTSYDNTNWN